MEHGTYPGEDGAGPVGFTAFPGIGNGLVSCHRVGTRVKDDDLLSDV